MFLTLFSPYCDDILTILVEVSDYWPSGAKRPVNIGRSVHGVVRLHRGQTTSARLQVWFWRLRMTAKSMNAAQQPDHPHLPRMLFLVLVSSGKFWPVSQSQKPGTARHSSPMKTMSSSWVTLVLIVSGYIDCTTIMLEVDQIVVVWFFKLLLISCQVPTTNGIEQTSS